jgi:K+-transporting ATPase ATPase C chain
MKELRPALLLLLFMSLLCGGLYPAIVTGLAQLLFPVQANGSLLTAADGRIVGSSLIGQPFSDPKYLWPRPSATQTFPYNPLASGGSNQQPRRRCLSSSRQRAGSPPQQQRHPGSNRR